MELICNKCGKVIPKPDLKTIRDGEIEHTYFLCPGCGEAYRVSTTDKHLRKRIGDYDRMSARLKCGNCKKEYEKRMQRLKKENVIRSRDLARPSLEEVQRRKQRSRLRPAARRHLP